MLYFNRRATKASSSHLRKCPKQSLLASRTTLVSFFVHAISIVSSVESKWPAGSLTTRCESIRDYSLFLTARRRPGIRHSGPWPETDRVDRVGRPNHPKSRVRYVCNADPGKPEPPATPTSVRLPRPTSTPLSRYHGERVPACPRSLSTRPDVLRRFYLPAPGLISRFTANRWFR